VAVAFPKTSAHTLFEHSLTKAEETWRGRGGGGEGGERRALELHVDRHKKKKKLANIL